jgi:hypothetical protein
VKVLIYTLIILLTLAVIAYFAIKIPVDSPVVQPTPTQTPTVGVTTNPTVVVTAKPIELLAPEVVKVGVPFNVQISADFKYNLELYIDKFKIGTFGIGSECKCPEVINIRLNTEGVRTLHVEYDGKALQKVIVVKK